MDKEQKKRIDQIVMVIGIGIMFAYSYEGFRMSIGEGMDLIFRPITALPIYVVILLMALITGLYGSIVQKYTMDWEMIRKNQEKSKEIQARMRKINKELREAQLEGNKYKIQKMEKKREGEMKAQTEMMRGQSDMMMQQFKPMFYSMPVVLPIFGYMRYLIYFAPVRYAEHIMTLPLLGDGTLGSSPTNVFGFMPYWFFWYFMCSILIGQIIRKALNIGGA